MVDKTWRNDWLQLKSVKHKIKSLDDARLKRCYHSAGPGQEVDRQAKRALFKSVLNCCCTAPVTRSVASGPCQSSGRKFLIVRSEQEPNHADFKFGNKVVRLVTLL